MSTNNSIVLVIALCLWSCSRDTGRERRTIRDGGSSEETLQAQSDREPDGGTSVDARPVDVRQVALVSSLPEQMQPVRPVDRFFPEDTVYLFAAVGGHPEKGSVQVEFFRHGKRLATGEATVQEKLLYTSGRNSYLGFTLVHEQPLLISARYKAVVSTKGGASKGHPFRVVPPPEAIKSKIDAARLEKGPSEPSTIFAPDDRVFVVGKATLGVHSHLKAAWLTQGENGLAHATKSITAERNLQAQPFSFDSRPQAGWPEGSHLVILTVDDVEMGRYPFKVVAR